MKIAVIGSGISGLSAAYYLSKKFKVDLYEQEDQFGGHSYTYDIKNENKTIPVDLGFIVFNKLTYPNLINFFNELKIPFDKNSIISSHSNFLKGQEEILKNHKVKNDIFAQGNLLGEKYYQQYGLNFNESNFDKIYKA